MGDIILKPCKRNPLIQKAYRDIVPIFDGPDNYAIGVNLTFISQGSMTHFGNPLRFKIPHPARELADKRTWTDVRILMIRDITVERDPTIQGMRRDWYFEGVSLDYISEADTEEGRHAVFVEGEYSVDPNVSPRGELRVLAFKQPRPFAEVVPYEELLDALTIPPGGILEGRDISDRSIEGSGTSRVMVTGPDMPIHVLNLRTIVDTLCKLQEKIPPAIRLQDGSITWISYHTRYTFYPPTEK